MEYVLYIFACFLVLLLVSTIRVCYYHMHKSKPNEKKLASLSPTKYINPSDITFIKRIGNGSYGGVWLCKYNRKKAVITIFSTVTESRPKESIVLRALTTVKHSKIVRIIRGGLIDTKTLNGYALITEYHPQGSLFGYLQHTVLDHTGLLKLCVSLLSGMDYLHMDISVKPAISHRNINTNNIVVNKNGECVIADFGSAVSTWKGHKRLSHTGITARYVAPELLDKTNLTFEEVKMGDIYAVGLTLWEICRRCGSDNPRISADPYKKAYQNLAPPNPSLVHMLYFTRILNLRPVIPEKWKNDAILDFMSKIISECWHETPIMRVTASRAKQNVMKMQEGNTVELAVIV